MFDSVIFFALLAGLFTWGITALGAATVFFAKDVSRKLLDLMLGFAAGVMLAASFWSLLAPAIEMSSDLGRFAFFPAMLGFILGALFLRGIDYILPHLHFGKEIEDAEGIPTTWKRNTLLILAITLHNIPEGLAIGVAFGALDAGLPSATLSGAIALALGIGLQNFPEGAAVSLPLRMEGKSRFSAFMSGQLSAIVEPIAAVIGAYAVSMMHPLLPYALAFAAGAMVFVVVEQLIPESQSGDNADAATLSLIAGFSVMMMLDVALG
ncbi:ZIP family metal transporter [Desulfovibrio litoralis]|uniref:Zinc transporter, ZIP family n=1 Tax=Desulfovibrio litoralis DSM 11393 TaxID=1121455 RepID=A0A1M7SGC5_9BACT|nr:ZIP family metal transporter [Desulfovibrio litoralis]SHN57521.1 zinc transporter, ZIP family [Desulfovibrio litoralis DSM 11393]